MPQAGLFFFIIHPWILSFDWLNSFHTFADESLIGLSSDFGGWTHYGTLQTWWALPGLINLGNTLLNPSPHMSPTDLIPSGTISFTDVLLICGRSQLNPAVSSIALNLSTIYWQTTHLIAFILCGNICHRTVVGGGVLDGHLQPCGWVLYLWLPPGSSAE